MPSCSPLETTLKHDRWIAGIGLAVLTALAWIHLAGMRDMPAATAWADTEALTVTFFMWVVMMVAMMVPSAAPTILLYAAVARRRAGAARPGGPLPTTAAFALGYLLAWSGFSAVITPVQTALQQGALLMPAPGAEGRWLAGVLFVTAGAYQLTPLKHACLEHCRSPLDFLATHWRSGTRGALRMGLTHGAFCVGCCWFLMLLLFAVGVMNLAWVAAIAAFVLAEKLVPRAQWLAQAAGVGLLGTGLVMLVS